ncbi:uncharacterized protein J4E78_003072 [Alternaria triticimaculans]|uniref:uncharacterized protein n=1 Tax=Alternaria triticimaculans TaxID=297637 RepID=UPI0020C40937|nr:uncharacterized protein J4E78_003072 [Alternaria triticimaculans]KAI4665610.1 hypothetical protein J4E78_003072 [Alternaria triticimaculans]
MSEEEMERQLAHQLRALNKLEQRQFLSLHNNVTGKRVFSGIFKTNALPCGPKSSLGAVYPTICFINHSCLPNSCYSWNAAAQMETVYVVRPIKAGEEITVCYTDPENTAARQAHLKNHFGFNCSCELCSLSIIDRKASDARRNQIYQLEEGFFAPGRAIFKPREALLDLRKMLELLNEEYKGGAKVLESDVYYDAVQLTISHGDEARASTFGKRAYEARLLCVGEDGTRTQEMKGLMNNPASHEYFGMSKKWKTAKDAIPRGLDKKDFEKWLWRLE